MKPFMILTAIVLVLTFSTSASAVVVMRTSPFPGYYVSTGSAHCAVINGGTTAGNATIALYDAGGTLLTSGTFSVPVNATRVGLAFADEFQPHDVRVHGPDHDDLPLLVHLHRLRRESLQALHHRRQVGSA